VDFVMLSTAEQASAGKPQEALLPENATLAN
jgi:hypothetical protein